MDLYHMLQLLLHWSKCKAWVCARALSTCPSGVYLAELRGLVGCAQDQLLHWQELLRRKLAVRACPSFPLGVAFKLRVYHCFPHVTLQPCCSCVCTKLWPPNLDLDPNPLAGLPGLDLPRHWELTGWSLGCVWPWSLSPTLILTLTCWSTSWLLGAVTAPTSCLVVLTTQLTFPSTHRWPLLLSDSLSVHWFHVPE